VYYEYEFDAVFQRVYERRTRRHFSVQTYYCAYYYVIKTRRTEGANAGVKAGLGQAKVASVTKRDGTDITSPKDFPANWEQMNQQQRRHYRKRHWNKRPKQHEDESTLP